MARHLLKTALKLTGFTLGAAAAATAVTGGAVAAGYIALQKRRIARFRNQVVLITGGSRGLGLELARSFRSGGAHLVLVARDEDELRRTRTQLLSERKELGRIEIIAADVSLREDATRAVSFAKEHFGRVDILINDAGIMQVAPFLDQPEQAFEEAMRTNFFGALNMIYAVLPQMHARRTGIIVNITSIGGKIAVPHMLPYVASKFALVGLSEGLHAELAQEGIQVTTVCPGLMRTGAHVQAQFSGRRNAEYRWFFAGATLPGLSIAASRAARQILYAVAAGRAEITITPQAWLAARIVGLAPDLAQRLAAKMNEYLLPAPGGYATKKRGAELHQPGPPAIQRWSTHLQAQGNQS